MASAFFYGTLMHPAILQRVIDNDGGHLELCPAALLEHTRHHRKGEDYPGVVPYSKSRVFFERELSPEDRSVRGTLVRGLTEKEIWLLDRFEGDEYRRVAVSVYPLAPFTALTNSALSNETIVPSTPPALPDPLQLPEPLPAHVYLYLDITELDPTLWTFEEFVKNNAWRWITPGAERGEEQTEADRRLADALSAAV